VSARHEPVLLDETLGFLLTGAGLYLDATLGEAGHAESLLDREPLARLLGCDRDPEALASARARLARFGDRVMTAHATFREVPEAHRALAAGEPLAGALLDLGLSSRQIDDPARGMSFGSDGPLDLRMDRSRGESAADWLRGIDAEALAEVLRRHGDVPQAGRVARSIVAAARAGALETTRELVACLERALGGRQHPRRLAQVFQALRIQVNGEAEDLDAMLQWLPDAVRPGGVVVTLAYHSGEDRRIKRAVRGTPGTVPARRSPASMEARLREEPWQEIVRRVVTPSPEEETRNPRARSARLRAFRRTSS
jgi:16S rRNA (cytosine1402-N4)-methyltransferase